jgi:hypothetical protein
MLTQRCPQINERRKTVGIGETQLFRDQNLVGYMFKMKSVSAGIEPVT